jgi:pyruvate/2-oxoglutarate/acetoin dehydrogenase E1 component
METLKETILRLTRSHISEGGVVMAQNLVSKGSLQGTLPPEFTHDTPGIVELPTQDSSNCLIAVGSALAGQQTMYVMRFQGFGWLNLWGIVNYGAKCRTLWDSNCPLFVRAIGVEGQIGPVAGGMLHSLAMHAPNMTVHAPMTPTEWERCYKLVDVFRDPVYCSEYRGSYGNTDLSMEDNWNAGTDFIIVGIGGVRMKLKAVRDKLYKQGINVSTFGLAELSPLYIPFDMINALAFAVNCTVLVVDSDYSVCGAAEHVAMQLHTHLGVERVRAMGASHQTAGFSKDADVLTPSVDEIVDYVRKCK